MVLTQAGLFCWGHKSWLCMATSSQLVFICDCAQNAAKLASSPGHPCPPSACSFLPSFTTLMSLQCLLNSTMGLNCPLAKRLMTPVAGGKVSHYIGILRTLTAGRDRHALAGEACAGRCRGL